MWQLTIDSSTSGTWSQISPSGSLPGGMYSHVASYDSVSKTIYVGGSSSFKIWKLSTLNSEFIWTATNQGFNYFIQTPTSQFVNGRFYIFCGYANGMTNDIRVYDPFENSLISSSTSGSITARNGLGSVYDVSNKTVYLIAGNDGNNLNDLWKVNSFPPLRTSSPTNAPTSSSPSQVPTQVPSQEPSREPTREPTQVPTQVPTQKPSQKPTQIPTWMPSQEPTQEPSQEPTAYPSQEPSQKPTQEPTAEPTQEPSAYPTQKPTQEPTQVPTFKPTQLPTSPTFEPTQEPTFEPTHKPTSPTAEPTQESSQEPTQKPTTPTQKPTAEPSSSPTQEPSKNPSFAPTQNPSASPTTPTLSPTKSPINQNSSSNSNSNSIGLIIGVVVGGSFFLVIFSLFYCFWFKKRNILEKKQPGSSSRNPISGNDIEIGEIYSNKEGNLISVVPPSIKTSSTNKNSSTDPTSQKNLNSVNSESINWEDIRVDIKLGTNAVVGRGSFGSVIRATWEKKGTRKRDVAIKILERRFGESPEQYQVALEKAKHELMVLQFAENCIGSESIVKAYGLAEGKLSKQLRDMFGISLDTVGIVMRFEEGGNLSDYLHGRNGSISANLNMDEKMSLITGIAQGLSDLHSVGIIHGDIKPDNILLDRIPNPKVRLADFGLSTIMEKLVGTGNVSTLRETKHVKGTLTYCAPEMLFDPRNPSMIEVAKASRKTDIFAFGILCWEILTQIRPFREVRTEVELSNMLHSGGRPPLDQLPMGTPPGIVELLPKTWAQDRSERVSAIEAFSSCQFVSQILATETFDIFFSHAWASKPFLSHVFRELTKAGYRVWYDQNDMGHDLTKSMKNGIMNSKIVLACVNPLYQTRENCMFELKEAKTANKNIISLVIEGNPFEWANDELKEICKFKTKMFVNIENVASMPWGSEETYQMMEKLKEQLKPLLALLKEENCSPSLSDTIRETH